jgi:serine/threonine protein kinase
MTNIFLILSILLAVMQPAWGYHSSNEPCKALVSSFSSPTSFLTRSSEIPAKYRFIKLLSGKSGATVALVNEISSGEDRIYKSLPEPGSYPSKEDQIAKSLPFREIYISCQLANLRPTPELPEVLASTFFPKYMESGFVDVKNAFDASSKASKRPVPYFVIEAIPGKSFTDYDLGSINGHALASVLYQIILALKVADTQIGFRHNDLHPGNILIANVALNTKVKHKGQQLTINGPAVKIIDFGLAKSDDAPSAVTPTDIWIKTRPVVAEMERFIKKYGPDFSSKTRLKIYASSMNQDLKMINMMMQALTTKLKQKKILKDASNMPLCNTLESCLDMVASWL